MWVTCVNGAAFKMHDDLNKSVAVIITCYPNTLTYKPLIVYMRKSIFLAGLILFVANALNAQDEGTIVKRERIDRSQNIFLSVGPSFIFGKNIGDYSTGVNIEAGYTKRVNRVFSVGPSISYIAFNYDPAKTKAETAADLYVGTSYDVAGWRAKYPTLPEDLEFDVGRLLQLSGGDISLLSLAVNLKLNFIPVTDRRKFSVYGFAKPFVAFSRREAVKGTGRLYVYESYEDNQGDSNPNNDVLYFNQGDDTWWPAPEDQEATIDQWDEKSFPALKEESKVTGGIFVGPGVEFMPAGKFSFFAQLAFGYTFPISYVSTESYPKTINDAYFNDEFPIVEKGFPSLNLQFGVSYNF